MTTWQQQGNITILKSSVNLRTLAVMLRNLAPAQHIYDCRMLLTQTSVIPSTKLFAWSLNKDGACSLVDRN